MVVAEKGKEKERRKEVKMRNEELVRDKIGNRKFSLSRRKLQEMEGEREKRRDRREASPLLALSQPKWIDFFSSFSGGASNFKRCRFEFGFFFFFLSFLFL